MTSICLIHRSPAPNQGICGRCRSCKHTTWHLKDGVYHCSNCYKKQVKRPQGEIWQLNNLEWEKI